MLSPMVSVPLLSVLIGCYFIVVLPTVNLEMLFQIWVERAFTAIKICLSKLLVLCIIISVIVEVSFALLGQIMQCISWPGHSDTS